MIETRHVTAMCWWAPDSHRAALSTAMSCPTVVETTALQGKDLVAARNCLQTMGGVVCSGLPITLFMCGCLQVGGLFRSEVTCSNGV